jgi:predicted phage terminase large subunit-like protein
MEYPDMERTINDLAIKWQANTVLVEDAGNGTTFIRQNAGKWPHAIVGISVGTKSKEFRFDSCLTYIEEGRVYLPHEAPWLEDYENELLSFPNAPLDDQVDMTSQYLNWACGMADVKYGSRPILGVGHKGSYKHQYGKPRRINRHR